MSCAVLSLNSDKDKCEGVERTGIDTEGTKENRGQHCKCDGVEKETRMTQKERVPERVTG